MGVEKVAESGLSDGEEDVLKSNPDDEIEEEEKEEETVMAGSTGEKEGENESEREGEADSEKKMKRRKKKKRKKKLQKKVTSRTGNKAKEGEVVAEQTSKGSPPKKSVKEEPRELEETGGVEEEDGTVVGTRKREVKVKKADGHETLIPAKSPVKQQKSADQDLQQSEEKREENELDKVYDVEDEEDERKEAESDLALTMSCSWVPLSQRERESLKVSKSAREERGPEIDVLRELQSESQKSKGRERDNDDELSKEKSKQKRQKFSEPPLLSLSLPGISVPLASSDSANHAAKTKFKPTGSGPAPKASETDRSFRSLGQTQALSNGYTNSLSLSLSHPFFHDASCSLTQNSFDDKEGTTGSSRQITLFKDDRPEGSRGSSLGGAEHLFHAALEGAHDRSKHRCELPLYQKLSQSGSPKFSQGALGNGEGTRDTGRSFMDEKVTESIGNHVRASNCSQVCHSQGGQGRDDYRWRDEASLASGGVERSRVSRDRVWSSHKDARERHRQGSWSSPSQSPSFQERRFDAHRILERVRRPDADAGRELSLSGSKGFPERDDESAGPGKCAIDADSAGGKSARKVERSWLHEIVTEPIPVMARKLQDVPDNFLEGLKRCLQDTLGSSKRKTEFVSLQRTLQRRCDLTTDSFLQSHRTQLEILVALKTGIPAFLHPDIPLGTTALTEIFLGTKCRNVACQSQLPADDCECKVCSSKQGFCNACMCVVCSKFDFDANTCRWIGCDFCLHWCHSDCGIQMGHISSGISTRGVSSDSVMQFRCIGCEHTSELYGFVKDVFTTCAKDWPLEILARELQCVRRIFHRSEDLRERQLFGKAEQLLVKLDSSRDVDAVCQSMMKFFDVGEKEPLAAHASTASDAVQDAVPLPREREMTSRLADAVREAIHVIKAPSSDGTDLEKARAALQFYDHEVKEKRQEASELHDERVWQKSQIEELENIVQIRQAEAKMFQIRADEVRREAEGLQRIVQAKTEKIEEEYKLKLLRLRLNESEERRRKWCEEVQNMEKAQREYSAMKMSMVSDIREFLTKVEVVVTPIS